MKLNFIKLFLILIASAFCFQASGQKSKTSPVVAPNPYPASFTIQKTELNALLKKKEKDAVVIKTNKYLNKSTVVKNVSNGDMNYFRMKLSYFKNAFLTIQVNGTSSTQVFLLSDDKSVFYKGRMDKGTVILTKCEEDEIVSE